MTRRQGGDVELQLWVLGTHSDHSVYPLERPISMSLEALPYRTEQYCMCGCEEERVVLARKLNSPPPPPHPPPKPNHHLPLVTPPHQHKSSSFIDSMITTLSYSLRTASRRTFSSSASYVDLRSDTVTKVNQFAIGQHDPTNETFNTFFLPFPSPAPTC